MKFAKSPLFICLTILFILLAVLAMRSPRKPAASGGSAQIKSSGIHPTALGNIMAGVQPLSQYPPAPRARMLPSQLRRGENNRLLLEEAVFLEREIFPGTLSREKILLPRLHKPVGSLTHDEHTLNAIESHLNPEALIRFIESSDQSLILPLNGAQEAIVDIKKVISRGRHSHTLIGSVRNNPFGDVLLVVHDGAVSGSVAFLDRNLHYQYAMAGNGDVAIRELDENSYPATCGQAAVVDKPDIDEKKGEAPPATQSPGEKNGTAKAPPAGTTIVDSVIGYGAQARAAQGGVAAIEAHILAAVDRNNLAFSNSGANIAFLSLMSTVEDPSYNYPGNSSGTMGSFDELGNLNTHGDGILDTVSQLRIDLGADQNSFVMRQADGSAGVAYLNNNSLIVARDYMTSTRIVLAHEIGHNIGCRHSWGDSPNDLGYNYYYGWRLQTPNGSRFRTIMAYDWNWGNGVRIPYFANPDVLYNGARTGANNGESIAGDFSADQRYVSGGLTGSAGRGFDGSHPGLGARNAILIRQRIGALASVATRKSLAVLEPSGAKRWDRGETETIFWHGGDHTDLVKIDLLKNGVSQFQIASNIPASQRYHDWEIPGLPNGSDYSIRITINGVITGDSNNFEIFSRENDEDGDGLPDPSESGTGIFLSELDTGTDPNDSDSDDDGFSDALEVAVGTDPNRSSFFPPHGGFILLENFESRLFTLNQSARNIRGWQTPDKADGITIETDPDNAGNRVGAINGKGSAIDIYLTIPDMIGEFSQGTLYFETRLQDNDNTAIGLSARTSPFSWTHFETHLQLKNGTYLNDAGVERRVGNAFENDRWIRVWIQVDNDLDTFQIHVQRFPNENEASPPLIQLETDEAQSLFGYRNGTTLPLQSFAIRTSSGLQDGEQLHIDNIYLNPTESSLINPTQVDQPGFTLMEDFESSDYTLDATINQIQSWNAINDPQALTITRDPEDSENRVGSINGVSRLTDIFLRLPIVIPDRDVGTLFFELRPDYDGTLSIGLSDESLPFLRASQEAELVFNRSYFIWSETKDINSQKRPEEDEWLKVWLVVQNDIDMYQVYTQKPDETGPSKLDIPFLGSNFPLRNGTDNVMRTLLIQPDLNLSNGEQFYLDNIYLDTQTINLIDPTLIPEFPTVENFTFHEESIEVTVTGLKADQKYTLERTDQLGGVWTIIAEDFVPDSVTHTFIDEEPVLEQGYYRFQVEILSE